MENMNGFQGADKINRILHLYSKIMDGEIVNKADMAKKFGYFFHLLQIFLPYQLY